MGPLNIVLWLAGVVLIGDRLQPGQGSVGALPGAQGRRTPTSPATSRGAAASADDGSTGASVAMAVLRRQAQIGGAIAIVGVVLVFIGFLVR